MKPTEEMVLGCPFCGEKPEVRLAMGEHWVHCVPCEASGKSASRREVAIAAWNARPSLPLPDREEIARIIDYEGYWERLDNIRAALRLGLGSDDDHMALCHVRDEEIAGTEESLAKADDIQALFHSPARCFAPSVTETIQAMWNEYMADEQCDTSKVFSLLETLAEQVGVTQIYPSGCHPAALPPSSGDHDAGDGVDWADHEDEIADAISDSIDMDWSSRDGAKAVVRYLQTVGAAK